MTGIGGALAAALLLIWAPGLTVAAETRTAQPGAAAPAA
jgi:hypothetical protein